MSHLISVMYITLKGYSKVRGAVPIGKKPVVMAEVVDEAGDSDS